MLGAIGSKSLDDVILFEVSSEKILTIDNFVRNNSVRFAKNDVLLKKPVSQYVGPDLDEISFDIILKSQYGAHPQEEMNKLIYIQRDGTIVSILIGETVFGVHRWRIKELGMPWETIDNKGNLLASTCKISLEEYV